MKSTSRWIGCLVFLWVGFLLCGCHSRDAEGNSLNQYENGATKALIRKLVPILDEQIGLTAQQVHDGEKTYVVTLGEIVAGRDFTPISVKWMNELKQGKERWISASVVAAAEPNFTAVDPYTRAPVYVIQLRLLNEVTQGEWNVEVGLSYKNYYAKQQWKINTQAEGYEVELVKTLQRGEATLPVKP
jgi:hypothetical protein